MFKNELEILHFIEHCYSCCYVRKVTSVLASNKDQLTTINFPSVFEPKLSHSCSFQVMQVKLQRGSFFPFFSFLFFNHSSFCCVTSHL